MLSLRRGLLGGQGWFTRRGRAARSLLAARPPPPGEAYVRIWASRISGPRGLLSVHCRLVYRRPNKVPVRRDVLGRRARTGRLGVQTGVRSARDSWAANPARPVHEVRGAEALRAIPCLKPAIAAYPHPVHNRSWPGPNCNSFVAALGRALPELHSELPPNALGKDFLARGALVAAAPSGMGVQVSLLGLVGVTPAAREGVELNLLGLTIGIDLWRPALKLPGLGRVPLWRSARLGLGPMRVGRTAGVNQVAVRDRRPSIG